MSKRDSVRGIKVYGVRGFNGDGRSTERPYNRYSSDPSDTSDPSDHPHRGTKKFFRLMI